MYQRGF
ncbi:hypothetical protein LINPERPRIM_LOCUS26846 [Linum perenne]